MTDDELDAWAYDAEQLCAVKPTPCTIARAVIRWALRTVFRW